MGQIPGGGVGFWDLNASRKEARLLVQPLQVFFLPSLEEEK
jgi:hypothetical protein